MRWCVVVAMLVGCSAVEEECETSFRGEFTVEGHAEALESLSLWREVTGDYGCLQTVEVVEEEPPHGWLAHQSRLQLPAEPDASDVMHMLCHRADVGNKHSRAFEDKFGTFDGYTPEEAFVELCTHAVTDSGSREDSMDRWVRDRLFLALPPVIIGEPLGFEEPIFQTTDPRFHRFKGKVGERFLSEDDDGAYHLWESDGTHWGMPEGHDGLGLIPQESPPGTVSAIQHSDWSRWVLEDGRWRNLDLPANARDVTMVDGEWWYGTTDGDAYSVSGSGAADLGHEFEFLTYVDGEFVGLENGFLGLSEALRSTDGTVLPLPPADLFYTAGQLVWYVEDDQVTVYDAERDAYLVRPFPEIAGETLVWGFSDEETLFLQFERDDGTRGLYRAIF